MSGDLATLSLAWLASPFYVDFTARQNALLGILCDEPGPHHVRDLAKQVGVEKPVITRACNSFGAQGIIVRLKDVLDGRSCIIEPTDHGRKVRAAMKAL